MSSHTAPLCLKCNKRGDHNTFSTSKRWNLLNVFQCSLSTVTVLVLMEKAENTSVHCS